MIFSIETEIIRKERNNTSNLKGSDIENILFKIEGRNEVPRAKIFIYNIGNLRVDSRTKYNSKKKNIMIKNRRIHNTENLV